MEEMSIAKKDYTELENYLLEKLENNRIAVLATCGKEGKVTARSMSIINKGLEIWFQSDSRFLKTEQIRDNPNVALAFANIQIEGKAEITGHSSLPENSWFCDEYSAIHPGSFKMYTSLPNQLVFRVIPEKITSWHYKDNRSYRDIILVSKGEAFRQKYMDFQ